MGMVCREQIVNVNERLPNPTQPINESRRSCRASEAILTICQCMLADLEGIEIWSLDRAMVDSEYLGQMNPRRASKTEALPFGWCR